jgi:type I restriction enzyme S subunit
MSSFDIAPLMDVVEFREGPGIMAADFRSDGIPLVRLSGLKPGADVLDGCNYLDPIKVARRWSHFRLEQRDVLLSTSASLGEVAVVGPNAVGAIPYTGIIRFRPLDHRMLASFIPVALRSPEFKQQIVEMGVGSVMNHFGPTHLKHMTLTVPPVEHQRAIAEVLGALDDKIAANARLAAKAHELAVVTYRKASSDAAASDSTFADLAVVGGGGTPKTGVEDFWGGDVAWATPTDVTPLVGPYLGVTKRTLTAAGLQACASPLYPEGSILMTSRATIGAFAVAECPMAVNQGFIVVNAVDPSLQWWLFHQMQERVEEFVSHANGATFMELSRGAFKQFRVLTTDDEAMRQFGRRAAALHDRARAALVENQRLAATLDTLLPLLMSGQVRVKDAEVVADRVGL